jgi:hypothetical protein
MRVPNVDTPRRPLGIRAWLIGAAVLIVVLLLSLRGLARVYTDYLWFKEVGFSDTWRGLVAARFVPALIFSAFFFLLMLVNLIVADRIAPKYRSMGSEDEIIEKYRTYVAPYAGRLRVIVSLFFALVMGGGVASEWRSWILFSNSVEFGVEDPQFHKDIGFYVFRLPFMRFTVGWLFAALLVVLIVTAIFHYINGGIRVQSPWQRVTPQVKVHLSVILALMALTKTAQYYLAQFELAFSRRGIVDGASYTDVNAQLPALRLLMIISVAAAILFVVNIWRRGWVFPIIAVGLWAFISLIVGTIYPLFVQRFQVQPNEFSREEPYIERNIEATRAAFALDEIEVKDFDYSENVDAEDVIANQPTFDSVRLWDPPELEQAAVALEERRPYYKFNDVDVDRYTIDGRAELSLTSTRELDEGNLPSGTWTNRHLVYTHGYAAVIGDAAADSDSPTFTSSNIPPRGDIPIRQTGIYFGESLSGYAVVGTKVAEAEPGDAETDQDTRYEGDGGVSISGFMRRAAFALRFGDWNLFVSGQLTGDSRIIYNRSILDRVETAAPFLHFDADPYPVVLDGRILWVIDAYTTTNRYPYSQSIHPQNLEAGSGLDHDFNYVRNSVKATVDAYDGTITFYVVDPSDPIIRAYERAFPDLFTDVDEMPDGLRAHWRYPEDLFRSQTEQYGVYHMTDAREFYQKGDLWDVAPSARPEENPAVGPTTTQRGNNGGRNTTLSGTTNPIDPLYLEMQLPGEESTEFLLQSPFVPRRKDNVLQAFMFARSDGENYGKLVVYVAPPNTSAPSPVRAATRIESTDRISEQFSLLDQRGSTVIRGDIQLLPVGDSIMYFRPIYVEGAGGQASVFPRLQFVAATYGERAVLVDTTDAQNPVDTAVRRLLRLPEEPTSPGEEPTEPTEPTEPGGPTEPGPDVTVAELLDQAAAEFAAADEALRAGDLGEYQRRVRRAQTYLEQAQQALDAGAEPPASTTTTTGPTGA